MVQDDYRDLLGGAPRTPDTASGEAAKGADADPVASNAYGVCEYLDRFDLVDAVDWAPGGPSLTYHGHCHQKATTTDHHAVAALRRAGHEVDPLDSGCCGMAGSFGYEAEHYAMSQAIGELLFEQVEDGGGERVVAPGVSCRTQLAEADVDVGGERPAHPVEVLAGSLPG
jgi:Fe-S oxidoreductase